VDRGAKGKTSRPTTAVKRNTSEGAYRAAIVLLAARDRTRRELSRRLAAGGFSRVDAEAALERLLEEGYLDDRRFASAWARGRLRTKPMGPHRLGRELEAKGVEEDLVREMLSDIYDEGEDGVARRAIAGKLGLIRHLPVASRTGRLARFLQRRGFSSEVIWRLLREERQGKRSDGCSG
jgi:regulatory protein